MSLAPIRNLSLALMLLLLGALSVGADTLTVTNTSDSGPGSLLQTINDAQSGDTIQFDLPAPGPWTIMVTSNWLIINKNLTINGPGAANLRVRTNQGGSGVFRSVFWVQGGTATIQGMTLSHGVGGGGGILNQGALTVNNCVIEQNYAFSTGGGLQNLGTMTLNNCTLNNNTTSGAQGGGLYNHTGATATLSNCTVTANDSSALYNRGALTISNCTIASNSGSSGLGGGIANVGAASTVNIKNSILANNSNGNLTNAGAFNVAGVNYSTDGSCPGFSQVTSAQLNLGSLANNGGPTPTMELLTGSVAIDAATDGTDWFGNSLPTDQRGIPRPRGAGFDVGAFEALQNLAPDADAGANQTLPVPHDGNSTTNTAPVTLDGSASSDPNNDALTYQWTDENNVVVATTETPTLNLAPGTYTFTLVVSDPYGASSDPDSVTVTVTPEQNQSPIADAGPDQDIVTRDFVTAVQLNGSASSDPNNDTLDYYWITPEGWVFYSPNPTINVLQGVTTFTLEVTDPYGVTVSDTVTITVTPNNQNPVAQDDTASTVKNREVTFPVIFNDSDPDNDPFNFTDVTTPSHGTVVSNPDGTMTYTPETDYVGSDSFTYTIEDNYGGTDTATVSITVFSGDTEVTIANGPFSGTVGQTITLKADLRRVGDNAGLPGRPMRFRVDGSDVGFVITDAGGSAEVSYQIPDIGAGDHTVTVDFTGDGIYNASGDSDTLTVAVTKLNTYFGVPPNATGGQGNNVIIRARLRRKNDTAVLPGKTVTFFVDGNSVGTAVTGADGYAAFTYAVPSDATTGSHSTQARFDGDAEYNGCTANGTLTITKPSTYFGVPPNATGGQGNNVVIRARLRRSSDTMVLSGKTVTFLVDGNVVGAGVTGADGYASVTYAIPAGTAQGAHTTQAQFAGDAEYNGCTANGTLTVTKPNTYFGVFPNATGSQGQDVTIRARLRRKSDTVVLPGKTVTFLVDGVVIGTAVTGADGMASLIYAIPVDAALGSHPTQARFDGDAEYSGCTGNGTLTVN